MSKDKAIITQVAAKIASELAHKTQDMEATLADWELAFHFVNDKLLSATGMSEEANLANTITAFNATVTTGERPTLPAKALNNSVQIAGKQHGDLPNWLITACQKAGVSKVWDNRDTAVGTKRPWFKQADAVDGQEPAAFWPPKGN